MSGEESTCGAEFKIFAILDSNFYMNMRSDGFFGLGNGAGWLDDQ